MRAHFQPWASALVGKLLGSVRAASDAHVPVALLGSMAKEGIQDEGNGDAAEKGLSSHEEDSVESANASEVRKAASPLGLQHGRFQLSLWVRPPQ
jgi:hypothetical protein